MAIEYKNHNVKDINFVEVLSKETIINSEQDILDLIVDIEYQFDSKNIIVYRNNLNDAFFDLKTRFAGDIFLKLSNYKIKFGIIGDFSDLNSTFQDLIYESNKNGQTVFSPNTEKAIELMN